MDGFWCDELSKFRIWKERGEDDKAEEASLLEYVLTSSVKIGGYSTEAYFVLGKMATKTKTDENQAAIGGRGGMSYYLLSSSSLKVPVPVAPQTNCPTTPTVSHPRHGLRCMSCQHGICHKSHQQEQIQRRHCRMIFLTTNRWSTTGPWDSNPILPPSSRFYICINLTTYNHIP